MYYGYIDISMNSKGQWHCEYTPKSTRKKISKTFPQAYRKIEALANFDKLVKQRIKELCSN